MVRSLVLLGASLSTIAPPQIDTQISTPSSPVIPHHQADFDAKRAQANTLFLAQKYLEALPLYADLSSQDPTVAVFAERYGACLLMQSATISDPGQRAQVHLKGVQEVQRAQSLGDNTDYVRGILAGEGKNFMGAVLSDVPLSVGYTYKGKAEAQAAFRDAEAAFGHSDWAAAANLYVQAATLDPAWYSPALFAGDCFYRLKDLPNASAWFAKAIAIDPDRETAYRYWGDALFQSGDPAGARDRFIQAVVAEPYSTLALNGIRQWARLTGHQLVTPSITRPELITPNGTLQVDPILAASTQDGRSAWIFYQQYRVAHGARTLNQPVVAGGFDKNAVLTPNGYRHTITEEHAALRAMLADIDARLTQGTLTEANLDPSIRNLRALEKGNVLGAWIAINAADAGIRSDYAEYRANHRQHLAEYVGNYLVR